MERVWNFLSADPWVLAILIAIAAAICVRLYFQTRVLKLAQWMALKGQYEPLEQAMIEEALRTAGRDGYARQFLKLLSMIRSKYGHDGVRTGHLYWIWELIEKGEKITSELHVPSFVENDRQPTS